MNRSIDSEFVERETFQPLAGDGLYFRAEDFEALMASVRSFWTELGEAIRRLNQ